MLPKFIIRDFIEQFSILDGTKANIQINHKLYGNQKANLCVLHPFVDDERIGFITDDGERKYITMDELCDVSADGNGYFLKGDVMEIYIEYIL